MILVDANLIFYAEDSRSAKHDEARDWWDGLLSGGETVGLAWITICAFLRISTNPRAVQTPLSIGEASQKVDSWLTRSNVVQMNPGVRFWPIYKDLLSRFQASANLSSDAFFAAIAMEHDCELCSTDFDFARFEGLRWRNPLA